MTAMACLAGLVPAICWLAHSKFRVEPWDLSKAVVVSTYRNASNTH